MLYVLKYLVILVTIICMSYTSIHIVMLTYNVTLTCFHINMSILRPKMTLFYIHILYTIDIDVIC